MTVTSPESAIDILKTLFQGRTDCYGTYGTPNPSDKSAYQVKSPLTDNLLRLHLAGKKRIGIYPLVDCKTKWGAVDIDRDNLELAESLTQRLKHYGLIAYVERSKGKGFHVWVFFQEWVEAKKFRVVMNMVFEELALKVELFPKQDEIKDRYGNFLNLPLFNLENHGGKTVFLDIQGAIIPDQVAFLQSVELNPGSMLDELVDINDLGAESPGKANELKSVPDPITKILSHCQYLNGLHVKTKELHHLEHEERIHFANVFLPLQGGREWLHEVYSTLSDYDREFTDKQLESLHARPTRCITMCKMLCPAITGRGGKSPVAFAYPKKTQDTGKKLELTPLSDLFQEPEEAESWLVDGLLPTSGFSLLAGKPKAGKSTIARNLALQIAQGGFFLGRQCLQGEVVYLALEEKRREVTRHFKAMGATGEEPIFVYASTAPQDGIRQLYEIAKERKPALVIVDPLFRLAKVRDGNDYVQVTAAMEPLLQIARESGSHVLCVHHAKKGGSQDGDSILGSSAIFGSVDTALFLKRSERYRTLSSQQRYGEDLEEIILSFDSETRQTLAGGSKEDVETDRVKIGILDFLKTHVEAITEKEINEGIEGRNEYKRRCIRELLKEGKIIRTGAGGRYDPFKYSSCPDVPHIYRGQEGQDEKNDVNPDKHLLPACPQVFEKSENLDENPGTRRNAGNKYIDLEQGVDFLTVEGGANV